jgi:hypothetical protein
MKTHQPVVLLGLFLATSVCCLPGVILAGSQSESITAAAIRGHIYFLASDALEGRYVGSDGYETAARYGESQFMAAGLIPIVRQGGVHSYLQTVPVLRRMVSSSITLTVTTAEGEAAFQEGEEFIWLQGEAFPWVDRRFEAVFVGYGISEPEQGWDDLKGLDIRGKIVVLLLGAPTHGGTPVLPEGVHNLYAPPSSVYRKMATMMQKGASGILVLPDPMLVEGWGTLPSKADIPQFEYASRKAGAIHIPLLLPIKPEIAAVIFAGQEHAPQTEMNAEAEVPPGFELEGVSLAFGGSFSEEAIPTWNVVGMVKGSDPDLRNEYVVVTAHLDSTAPREKGEINNGADDNASGCAGLIEIAKIVAEDPPKRSVIFVLCSGEEAACIGSRHFVSDPPVPLDRMVADINMDMIGRTDPASTADRSHYVIDSGKITPELTSLIKEVNRRTVAWPLKYESPIGNSDNLMFHLVGIPALSFYSGHHEDVNQPTDDAEKIDYEKAEKIARLAYEITMELGNRRTLW